jgi:GT2 family glycosyltransferase
MKVAIVILNWNGRGMLERFMPSVVKYSHRQHFSVLDTDFDTEVVVADNGSSDDSLPFLQQNYPDVPLVFLDRNYGFAEGYNKALAQVEADYYVLLNSDVECTPRWIEPVIRIMDANSRIAVMQPKLLMYDSKDTFEYAGGAGGFIDSIVDCVARGGTLQHARTVVDGGAVADFRDNALQIGAIAVG